MQRTLFTTRRDHANSRYEYIVDMLQVKQLAGKLSLPDIRPQQMAERYFD